jgi:hypothetical protein
LKKHFLSIQAARKVTVAHNRIDFQRVLHATRVAEGNLVLGKQQKQPSSPFFAEPGIFVVTCRMRHSAAIDRFEICAEQHELQLFCEGDSKNVSKLVKHAVEFVCPGDNDVIIFDTAEGCRLMTSWSTREKLSRKS